MCQLKGPHLSPHLPDSQVSFRLRAGHRDYATDNIFECGVDFQPLPPSDDSVRLMSYAGPDGDSEMRLIEASFALHQATIALEPIGNELNSSVVPGILKAVVVLLGALRLNGEPGAYQQIEAAATVFDETIRRILIGLESEPYVPLVTDSSAGDVV